MIFLWVILLGGKMIEITSLQNLKIKEIIKLRSKNKRDKNKLFLIEGYREILRAFQAGVDFNSLYICDDLFLGSNENELIEKIQKKVEVYACKKNVFEKISYRDRPDGLLAIAYQKTKTLDDLKNIITKTKTPFLVICESIEKPGNLGTILRSSDGVNADAVVVCDPTCDIYNPNVVRASIGSLFTQNVIVGSASDIIKLLQDNNIKIVATTPHSDLVYTDTNLTDPIAIVVGTEQYGLSEIWLKNSDINVKIPMLGVADSLNVATATTILLYEVIRQRHSIH